MGGPTCSTTDERAMLLDIENHLLAEDPGWSTAFSTYAWRARRQRTFELAFHAVASVVFAALALLMVVAHAPGPRCSSPRWPA